MRFPSGLSRSASPQEKFVTQHMVDAIVCHQYHFLCHSIVMYPHLQLLGLLTCEGSQLVLALGIALCTRKPSYSRFYLLSRDNLHP